MLRLDFEEGTPDAVNQILKDGSTPLQVACKHGHVDIVARLLEENVINVNAENNQGLTALLIAIEKGNLEICEYLVEHPKIEVTSFASELAIINKNVAIAELLRSKK